MAVGTRAPQQPATEQNSSVGWRRWYASRRGRGALEIGALFLLVQIILIAWSLISDSFPYLSEENLSSMTQSIPWLALLAVGSGIVIMVGEIDLSVAMNMGMAELVWLTWYSGGHGFLVSSLLALLVTVAVGLGNAWLVNRLRIPSVFVTLGMYGVLWGAQQLYVGVDPAPQVTEMSDGLRTIFTGELFYGIHAQVLWLIGIGVVMWALVQRHRIGRHVAVVGGNEEAAASVGINPKRVRYVAFAGLGLLAGSAAILHAVQHATLSPGGTRGIELVAIAGAIVGGTDWRGGKGSVLGMILGIALLESIAAVFHLSDALSERWVMLVVGAAIIAFAAGHSLVAERVS